jgi:superfamily II DNA or RNA helicase
MPPAEAPSANSLAETPSPRGGAGIPAPGQIARVRQRLYLVEQTVAAPRAGDSTLVRMSCVDDDAQGQPLEVLWEREIDPKIITGEAWDAIARRGFDAPNLFSAYLNTLRWNCVTATDPKLFQSPFRAGIRLDAYQLEPLRKALLLPRVNLFIADDVGLGKTIEALLIARELLLRKKVKEIVVACPPSMLLQWRDEMEQRFGLTFEILDKAYMARVRRERGYGVNPWSTHTRFLISHRLLIDEAYTNPLLDWLDTFRSGTLLILDEAHHAAPSSGQKYAIDSQITRAIRELAPRFEHRLFLSATPHNGHSNSFSALLEILDPQRFCRGVPVTKKMLDDVMVRRLKEDIREVVGGFAKRTVVQLDIDGLSADAPELRLSALLDQYRTLREQRLAGETKRKQAAAGLLVSGLQQRLLSSIEAFARTLKVHRRTVQRQWEQATAAAADTADRRTSKVASSLDRPLLAAERTAATDYAHRQHRDESAQSASPVPVQAVQLDLLSGGVGADDDRANLPEDELRAEEEAQIEAASAATIGPLADAGARTQFVREQKLLDEMTEIAEQARGQADARIKLLIRWIQEKMCLDLPKAGAKWNDLRIIIFTEYDDTKRYLHQQLLSAIERTDQGDGRIAIFHGPTPADEREEIKQAFNGDPAKYPVRILIATDAAREGLNLQAHCWNLFHFDVPWNPSRMEQRNGRIDRKLQPKSEVFCHYFVYRQRPEDRILRCLVRKTERIKQELGSLAQVIDVRLSDSLKLGIRRSQIDEMEKKIDSADLDADRRRTVEDELEASRERQDALREQIDRLRTRLDESKRSIGLDQEPFRLAISSALELMGAEPLKPVEGPDGGAPRCVFPTLDQREGADPTWADTMDTLRAPRPRDQKRWEWRRTSPIRPVVFEDQGMMDDRVVHLHLEHRIVQRLLGRFIAQGFVHHDLSRACLAQTSDAIPRVILLGRLCLYGPGAARLHEELIPVTARWTDPKLRKSPLTPYARDAETKTLDLLEDSLRSKGGRAVTSEVQNQLQSCAPRDVQELLSHLQTRGEQYAEDAKKKLVARAEAEAKAMREILETQKKHIQDTAAVYAKNDSKQLKLRFGLDEPTDEEERRQLEANKRHWGKRLVMIDEELKTEPVRIREVYDVKATRIEPVGLIYLWPVTG